MVKADMKNALKQRIKNLEKRLISLPGPINDNKENQWRPQIANVNLEEIIKQFASMLDPLIIEADQLKDMEVVNKLLNIMQPLREPQLSVQYRFEKFLQALFKNVVGNDVRREKQFNFMGECAEDRVFFLLSKCYYMMKFENSEAANIWKEIYKHCTYRHRDYHMDDRISWLIRQTAKNIINSDLKMVGNFSFFSKYDVINVKLNAWHHLLDSTSDSKTIWKEATTKLFPSFIELITVFKLKLFEPYAPLSQQEYIRLKNYINQQVNRYDNPNRNDIKATY